MDEYRDVVVIGARLAGASAASHLARAGVDVVVLDRSSFPSDQLSTHLLFPDGLNEVRKMGALDGILAHQPTKSPWLKVTMDAGTPDEFTITERWRHAGPIDYCLCVPRILQDVELVKAARAAGADVRERHKLVEVLWKGGRAVGVRYADPNGNQHNIYARVVLGADGRRSSVASQVGAFEPYRASKNGRGLVFRYADDPRFGTRDGETIFQWRDQESYAFLFPSVPAPKMLVLFMGAAEEARVALEDGEDYWQRKLRQHPGVAERLNGATGFTAIRATGDTTSYFRASSGPGWALIGDAGHFKDPVIGQGQRDALWSGRRIAEVIAEALHDPATLDRALQEWEHERDAECLHAYHFGNIETAVEPISPVVVNLFRRNARTDDVTPDAGDLFGRARTMPEVLTLSRLSSGALEAAQSRGRDLATPESRRRLLRDFRVQLQVRAELAGKRFRSTTLIPGSDHPDPEPPKPVRQPSRVKSSTREQPAEGPTQFDVVPNTDVGSKPRPRPRPGQRRTPLSPTADKPSGSTDNPATSPNTVPVPTEAS
ncbi:NAD(P)/FAD-dependent oxidoreductase [Gordonia sp. NB41Y]|uniref:NAD(P)/FAD-dependent oxidoreductase n=1 Tax=Gordonia sp. NB41Y TaxID=875808 RepID=UPI0002BD4CAE|nr:NAD(P)/FAD-dependent oxidoreductase [Gordonia sp. NB41Y]WLP89936.1 NAD(P)/FAD-dependent oxidoreductase [Gordonia sp. NB41Y]